MDIITFPGSPLMTNSYILKENNNILTIDFVPELIDYIKKNDLYLKKVLLTHIHFDHIIGLSEAQKLFDFTLYLSEKAYKNINNQDYNLLSSIPEVMKTNINEINLKNAQKIKNNQIIDFENHNIKVYDSPGHSDESVMYIIENEKTVFTGDTIFQNSVGRTDFRNSNFDDMINSIKGLFKIVGNDYILYPGHGPSTTVLMEKQYNPFIK